MNLVSYKEALRFFGQFQRAGKLVIYSCILMMYYFHAVERNLGGRYAIEAAYPRTCTNSNTAIGRVAPSADREFEINLTTVAKWRECQRSEDQKAAAQRAVLNFLVRRIKQWWPPFVVIPLLPLDDCLYALQATAPHQTCSAAASLFSMYGISRLSGIEGDKSKR